MGKKIALVFNLAIIIVFAVFISDFFGFLGRDSSVTISIEEGDGISSVAKKLKKENIVISSNLFTYFYKIGVNDMDIKSGDFTVNSKMSYNEILDQIERAASDSLRITIPEGFENREIARRLLDNEVINNENEFYRELEKYSFNLTSDVVINGDTTKMSGYLFPDTYQFYHNSSTKEVVEKMTVNFKKHWENEYIQRCRKLNMSVEEIVVLASIIEREAKGEEDFYKVSGVFHNRLKKSMKLESCATVQYILKERKAILSISDTKIKSPYNTYLNKGLPPTAICSPGALALKAALYPDEHSFLFFFTDKDGANHYSKTLEEHNAQIEEYGL